MIYFDFNNVYKEEYSKRLANFSFYKLLDQLEVTLEEFINEYLIKEEDFTIICASNKQDEYLNYFIRVEKYNIFINNRKVLLHLKHRRHHF